jgi:hypothetical protein
MSARHTPGPLGVVMTAEDGETWRVRSWAADRSSCVTFYKPSKVEADNAAKFQRLHRGGTTCVDRIATQRIGRAAITKATGSVS